MKIYLQENLTHEYFHTRNFPDLQYLLSLQECRSLQISVRKVQVGDILILKEDGTAKCLWKLAKAVGEEAS